MREALWRLRPNLWASGQRTLLPDNARPHTALISTTLLCFHIPVRPLTSLRAVFLFPRLENAKRTAEREYRGYSSGCDERVHIKAEGGVHKLLPGLAETLATVY
jgi:hypothetical protein